MSSTSKTSKSTIQITFTGAKSCCSRSSILNINQKVSLIALSEVWELSALSNSNWSCCESRCEIGWFRVLFDQFRLSRLILKFFFFLQISSSTWDIFFHQHNSTFFAVSCKNYHQHNLWKSNANQIGIYMACFSTALILFGD